MNNDHNGTQDHSISSLKMIPLQLKLQNQDVENNTQT